METARCLPAAASVCALAPCVTRPPRSSPRLRGPEYCRGLHSAPPLTGEPCGGQIRMARTPDRRRSAGRPSKPLGHEAAGGDRRPPVRTRRIRRPGAADCRCRQGDIRGAIAVVVRHSRRPARASRRCPAARRRARCRYHRCCRSGLRCGLVPARPAPGCGWRWPGPARRCPGKLVGPLDRRAATGLGGASGGKRQYQCGGDGLDFHGSIPSPGSFRKGPDTALCYGSEGSRYPLLFPCGAFCAANT